MKHSIVIPTLNEEENIAACIEEVKKQAQSAEIILVDGMSTDRTVEIARDLDVNVVFEKKRTIAAGRNTGLKHASGEIVCYLDADTIPEKSWFENIVRPFSDESVVAVGGKAIPIEGTIIENFGMNIVFGIISPILFRFGIPLVTGQNMAFRKKAALEAGGFITSQVSGEDTSIFLRLKKQGSIVHSNACVRVSMRRIRKWGLYKYILFNIKNFISLLRYEEPIKDDYEPVRK